MADLYFFVSKDKIEDVVDCGLKLSEWYDRELIIPGMSESKKVLKAFLNPRDDAEKMKNTNYQCVRLQLELDYCWVADASLYKMGQEDTRTMELYYNNIVPLKDYCFGTFRNPEVLVTTSVLPEYIKITGEVLDIPLLYENSEKLYLTNLREKYEEFYNDSGNHLLYAFFTYLESKGMVTRHEDNESKNVIFFYTGSKDYTVLRIP
ncbi:MAG TPA: hypothetical protein GXZ22_01120 [Clostridiaceae bacterium]|jgi:hypothetical protein|nr:hypothetical protein [Clostridiaceae bacterium]